MNDAANRMPGNGAPVGAGAGVRVAYLMSQYPAVSHTFFLREVIGLRMLGIDVRTASINVPNEAQRNAGSEEAAEFASTFYVKQSGGLRALLTLAKVALLRPGVVLRGLRAAVKMRPMRRHGSAYAFFYFVEALLLGEWMRREKLRHLHVHFATAVATVGCIAAAAYRVPVSLTVHGSDEFFDAALYALPQKIAQASFLVCISNFCRSQLMCLSESAHWGKMHVVRLGVNPKEFSPVPRNAHDAPRLLCVGRLVAAKGHRILLQAIAKLREQGILLPLTLVGDGPLRGELEAFAANHGIAEQVHFAGSCSRARTRELLAEADIFVLASFAEGVPVALMEAMAMQLPCVSTRIAGIPELIDDGENGILVAPSSVEDMAVAISALAMDASLRKKLGDAAREKVAREYNLTINLERLARVFAAELGREAA